MTFFNLLTNKVVISRLTEVSGNKTIYSTITSQEPVSIQKLDDEKAINIGGAIGKTFKLFADSYADIEVGDKLRDENGNEYKVKAVNEPANIGCFQHKEVILIKI